MWPSDKLPCLTPKNRKHSKQPKPARSIIQGDIDLYLATLYRILPWFFAFDRFDYAHWGTIHWFWSTLLEVRYKEFAAGKISFQITNSPGWLWTNYTKKQQVHQGCNVVHKQTGQLCFDTVGTVWAGDVQHADVASNKDQQKHHENSPTSRNDFAKDT